MNNHGHTYLKIKFADSSVVKNSRERNAHLFFLLLLVFSKGGVPNFNNNSPGIPSPYVAEVPGLLLPHRELWLDFKVRAEVIETDWSLMPKNIV